MASTVESSSRPGHLDTTWEVAVISSCIIIFVVAISVVIYQVTRRKRLRRMREEEDRRNTQRRSGEKTEKVASRTVPDLERGGVHTGDPGHEQDEDYTDLEDEGQQEYTKSKRNSTSSKSKTARSKKHPPLRKSDSPTSETEIVSHPSQMPPKYYWNHR